MSGADIPEVKFSALRVDPDLVPGITPPMLKSGPEDIVVALPPLSAWALASPPLTTNEHDTRPPPPQPVTPDTPPHVDPQAAPPPMAMPTDYDPTPPSALRVPDVSSSDTLRGEAGDATPHPSDAPHYFKDEQ